MISKSTQNCLKEKVSILFKNQLLPTRHVLLGSISGQSSLMSVGTVSDYKWLLSLPAMALYKYTKSLFCSGEPLIPYFVGVTNGCLHVPLDGRYIWCIFSPLSSASSPPEVSYGSLIAKPLIFRAYRIFT